MWLISLILTILYVIWITRLINFGVRTATQIAISNALTADRMQILVDALTPDAKERAIEAVKQRTAAQAEQRQVVRKEQDKKAFIGAAIAVGAIILLFVFMAVSAHAQSCCRGGAYTGAGSNPTPGVPRHASTQAHQRHNQYVRQQYLRWRASYGYRR
jgi:hypothetical protein